VSRPQHPFQQAENGELDGPDVLVSETARVVASLISCLPRDAVVDLRRLIQRRLTALNPHAVRYARLGLLVEIVSVGTGEVPSSADYEELRREKSLIGESWPAQASLSVAYGGWVNAVKAAMYLAFDGSSAQRSAASGHHRLSNARGPVLAYSHDEAVSALRECAQALGVWPTEHEYDEWRRLTAELTRLSGNASKRYPSRAAWKRLFGGWQAFEARALRAERSAEDDRS
jgi:hypothetical protein